MRSILHNLLLLLLATVGCTSSTATAQSNLNPHPVRSSDPRFVGSNAYDALRGTTTSQVKDAGLPILGPDSLATMPFGQLYIAAIPNTLQALDGLAPSIRIGFAPPIEDKSYLRIEAPLATSSREHAEAVDEAGGVLIAPTVAQSKLQEEHLRNTECENGTLRGKPCRVSWARLLSQSVFFLASQHGGNIAMDSDTRNQLMHGSFWGDYAYCVEHYRWSRWKDDDPFGVDYIGHPMMGAVTSSLYEQNDPKQRALMFENTQRYWMGRLRAMAYSAAYSAQWKVGPASEASIGNTGINYYIRARDGIITNETGMQDFFITPIGGLVWNVGEDMIDRFILTHVRHGTRNRLLLLASALTTPGKSAANVARFRAPYYRDYDLETAGALVH
jgi:hypothetical protein